jgi:hypothetical protein
LRSLPDRLRDPDYVMEAPRHGGFCAVLAHETLLDEAAHTIDELTADARRYRHLIEHYARERDDYGTVQIEFVCDFENYRDPSAAIDDDIKHMGIRKMKRLPQVMLDPDLYLELSTAVGTRDYKAQLIVDGFRRGDLKAAVSQLADGTPVVLLSAIAPLKRDVGNSET